MALLKKGSKGAAVKELQVLLNKNGAKPKLKEDSDFGPKTEAALVAFQKSAKLKPDGKAGEVSMAALNYGGPLPVMTVEDYEKRYSNFEKVYGHNKSVVQDYIDLSREIKDLPIKLGKEVEQAQEQFNEAADHWVEVVGLSKKIMEKQTEFAKKRLADPKAAEKLVKECEALEKQVKSIVKGPIESRRKKSQTAIDNSKELLTKAASSIQKTLSEIKKRSDEF
jgi:hypothetical protein